MRAALLVLVVLLPACTSTTAKPDEQIAVVWNRVDNPHEICEGMSGRKSFFNVLGCSHWQPASASAPRTCAIYAPAPRSERDVQRFATLGHELLHCFDGNWHDQWGRMNAPTRQAAANASAGGSAASVR